MTDGETLAEYNYRVGLNLSTSWRSEKMAKLDGMVKRKSDYPVSAIEFLNEVEERKRLEGSKKA